MTWQTTTFTAQLLPIPGEPELGEYFCMEIDGHIEPVLYGEDWNGPIPSIKNGCYKLGLFLLTNTVEQGDLIVDLYRPAEYGIVKKVDGGDIHIEWEGERKKRKYHIFCQNDVARVLGAVSSKAVWVTPELEIDYTDLALLTDMGDSDFLPLSEIDPNDMRGSKQFTFVVKCPSCKTFH